ncbi:alpha/beta fold hydrolase, partial [Psychrobacter sp. T6-1]|uniref:alpha/beta fold hydrolase n=1 Tax=Psychrobacter sp. T6-1 TaxID=3457447 RepID=UPI003FD4E3D5
FLRQLGVDNYHILAHDYGDTVAQELLARQADVSCDLHIASVCFLNGGLFPETHRPILIQRLLLSPLGSLVSKLFTKAKFATNLQRIFGPRTPPTPEVIDVLWQLLRHNDGVGVMHKLINYIPQRKRYRERWVRAIINSRVPVKLIAGAKDPISGQHMVNRYRELIPNADITVMAELGHYPQIEDSAAISAAYLTFRSSIGE